MGELARRGRGSGSGKEVVVGYRSSGSAAQKTLTVSALEGVENFVLYAEEDGVHTDTPSVLAVRKTGTSISASLLTYNDGMYIIRMASCTISGGTITCNANFRKSCDYRYVAW